jgi:hypothetical protein
VTSPGEDPPTLEARDKELEEKGLASEGSADGQVSVQQASGLRA